MVRPKRCRLVAEVPEAVYFKPRGISMIDLEEIGLELDEFEAVRLADLDGLYHEDAAKRMRVSRATFGRILTSAHRKVAEALVRGKALRIEGGTYETPDIESTTPSVRRSCGRKSCPEKE